MLLPTRSPTFLCSLCWLLYIQMKPAVTIHSMSGTFHVHTLFWSDFLIGQTPARMAAPAGLPISAARTTALCIAGLFSKLQSMTRAVSQL